MRDRNRGRGVPAARSPQPSQITEAVRELLASPSLSAQILQHAAEHLTRIRPTDPLTLAGWGRALARADAQILTGYPPAIAQSASCRVMAALDSVMWTTSRTRGEWAVCLTTAARNV
ncbi:hypothetical protein ACTFBT_16210 [Streptomyces microflavus]|uniref:hypothetical protein n=1 Tax=Streptomyces TaxID=1883 RepID=UPI00051796F1|nr:MULTISPECIES: hypothetical protein [Streptomyces]MDX2981230.1 hypothetical protein [Streptomyces sp. NRRL_B-2249]